MGLFLEDESVSGRWGLFLEDESASSRGRLLLVIGKNRKNPVKLLQFSGFFYIIQICKIL